MMELW
jgi:hypothetical protein